MDKKLETLLKYQELDIKLKRTLDTLEKSDANKKMNHSKNEFNNAKKTAQEIEAEAESIVTSCEQSTPQIQEFNDKFKELELIIENVEADELEGFGEQIEALKAKVVALEKKLSEYKANSEKLVKGYQEATAIGHKMRDSFNSAKEDYAKLVKASEPEVNAIKKQLKELEPQVDAELLEKYKAIVATINEKNPNPRAFVEVYISDDVYSCTGCGLQLSQKNTSELNENDFCTCETCRRIIYKR